MFNRFGKKSKPEPAPTSIRDTLFGDLSLDQWPNANASALKSEPWLSFVQARDALNKGKKADAIQHWQRITEMPSLEPRHYVQAWHFLRQNGVKPPPDKARTVYGVVVEVAMPNGVDLLAAYPDHSARYYNYSGAGVVWVHPNNSLDGAIDTVLDAGRKLVVLIGPWEGARPTVLGKGQARLSMLTPIGLHFGQGDFLALSQDPKGGALVSAATQLMVALTELAQKPK
ncbi:MAG: hypothetical protein ABI690_25825 [Chloroflexota bacterium]